MIFGKHQQLTYVEGSTSVPISAANLNENERVLDGADTELAYSADFNLKTFAEYFYMNNYKLMESFQDDTGFTAMSSTTVSADYANLFMGYQSTKMLENDNTASDIGMYKTISAFDLTAFNDSSSSTTGDFITFAFYISDYTKFTDLTFKLGSDNTNNYSVSYAPDNWTGEYAYNGFHVVSLPKADFISNGTPPAWSNITYIRCQATTVAGAQNEYISMQHIALCRVDADNVTDRNVFQKYQGSVTGWENVFVANGFDTDIVFDEKLNKIGIMMMAQNDISVNALNLKLKEDVICFSFKVEGYARYQDEFSSLTWYVDANNYIEVLIQGGLFYIYAVEGGSPSNISDSLDNTLTYNKNVVIEFTKNIDTVRAILKIDGETTKFLEKETTISETQEGNLYLGWYGSYGAGFITDLVISNNNKDVVDNWAIPKIVVKTADEDVLNSTTLQDDDELFVYLPPNGIFEVEAHMDVDGTNTGQDITIAWALTGDLSYVGSRNGLGPGYSSSDIYDATLYAQGRGTPTSVSRYGVVSAGWSYIQERYLITSGKAGGLLKVQWAQYVASATYPTRVKEGSYLKVTKVRL